MISKRLATVLLFLSLGWGLSLSGCAGSSSAAHEEDHLEHHVPAHRPPDLEEAARQVQTRWSDVRTMPPGAERTARWSELGDILRWLPEIAGASDLPRAEWDEIQRLSRELEVFCSAEAESGTLIETSEARRSELIQAITRLAPLASTSFGPVPSSPKSDGPVAPASSPTRDAEPSTPGAGSAETKVP